MAVIVTGSRGLIGSAVVEHLRKTQEVLELDLALGHDLTDEAFVKQWFRDNQADALVNLFALNDHVSAEKKTNDLMEISLESFDKFLKLNLTTLFSVCREFSRDKGKGVIVNFASTYGLVSPNPSIYGDDQKHIAYGVSKAGVVALTRHLATHLAPKVRVNCIAPGGVRHQQSEEFQQAYGELTPLGRMMDASELFGTIDLLISEASSYCTGACYPVDGGWTAW